jgi:hypothetical protein
VYAGAGLVPGSTLQGEWAETNLKLAGINKSSPISITLQGAPTPNVAGDGFFLWKNSSGTGQALLRISGIAIDTSLRRSCSAFRMLVLWLSVSPRRTGRWSFRALEFMRVGQSPAVNHPGNSCCESISGLFMEAGMDVPMLCDCKIDPTKAALVNDKLSIRSDIFLVLC